jgi:hypothetical protein
VKRKSPAEVLLHDLLAHGGRCVRLAAEFAEPEGARLCEEDLRAQGVTFRRESVGAKVWITVTPLKEPG